MKYSNKMKWFSIIISSIFLISLASALDLRYGSETLVNGIRDIFSPIIEAFFSGFSSEYLFEYFLFFLIIIAFVFSSLKRLDLFKPHPALIWIVTLSVALLSTRFLADTTWVQFVLNPYNYAGIALLSIIPFIVFFYFINSFNSTVISKFGWALYSVLYIVMWSTSYDTLGDKANIYFFAVILGLIMIPFSKVYRAWLLRSMIDNGLNEGIVKEIADANKRVQENFARLGHTSSKWEHDHIQKMIDKDKDLIKKLSKQAL